MITVDEAAAQIRAHVPLRPACTVPLADAAGRVLREELRADRELPPFDRVTMDGLAVSATAVAAGVRSFSCEGIQGAGVPPHTLRDAMGGGIQIMTGAVRPHGCDAVIPIEQLVFEGDRVRLLSEVRVEAGQYLHRCGSDRHAGDLLLAAGCVLGATQIQIAASIGKNRLLVGDPPNVGVVSVGDELVEPGRPLEPHQIRTSNAYAIAAALRLNGFPEVVQHHLPDEAAATRRGLEEWLGIYDVLILSGGVSKGRFDFVPDALAACGVKRIFQDVRQRPGKPFWFGLGATQRPVFALPGNPVSTLVCLHRLVLPSLREALGERRRADQSVVLAQDVQPHPHLRLFLPVRTATVATGRVVATPEVYHGSGDYAALAMSSGFVEIPEGDACVPAGTVVGFHPWAS